jgi:hypothetical protein
MNGWRFWAHDGGADKRLDDGALRALQDPDSTHSAIVDPPDQQDDFVTSPAVSIRRNHFQIPSIPRIPGKIAMQPR